MLVVVSSMFAALTAYSIVAASLLSLSLWAFASEIVESMKGS